MLRLCLLLLSIFEATIGEATAAAVGRTILWSYDDDVDLCGRKYVAIRVAIAALVCVCCLVGHCC